MIRSRTAVLAALGGLMLAGCIPVTGGDPTRVHTYYVAPNGNDASGTGTAAAPWQHFARAFSVMHAGDLLLLRDGTYHDSLRPPASRSGTAASPLMVWAEHDGLARINSDATRVPIDIETNDFFDMRASSHSTPSAAS